jgi:tetratricopeptide (TPR) repeat protein
MFSWFKRGTDKNSDAPGPATPAAAPAQAAAAPATVKVHDAYGRLVEIPREEWRKVLRSNLQQHRDDPARLYQLIVSNLDDGFAGELVEPSVRLLEIDPEGERSHLAHAIVLLRTGDCARAELVLENAIRKLGRTGTLLTNLAKAKAGRGLHDEARKLLWSALEADPNQDNALLWWAALERERGGLPAQQEAFAEVAQLPGSWRARLWLARAHLERQEADSALALYRQALPLIPANSDADMMICGDLGKHGRQREAVELVAPRYDPARGDLRTGLNLLQAYIDLRQAAPGLDLLEQMFRLGNSSIAGKLQEYSAQLDQLRAQQTPPVLHDQPPQVGIALLERPLWLLGAHDLTWAIPSVAQRQPRIALMALTVPGGLQGVPDQVVSMREEDQGRTSRTIPLFLAEQLFFRTSIEAHVMVPVTEQGGLVVFSGEETDEALHKLASGYDYVMTGTIHVEGEILRLRLRLRAMPGLEEVAQFDSQFTANGIGAPAQALADRVGQRLADLPGVTGLREPGYYQNPPAEYASAYMGALAQCLTLTLIRTPEQRAQLWGERNILNWLQGLSLAVPSGEAVQFMYLTSLLKAQRSGSQLMPEFRRPALAKINDLERAGLFSARLAPMVHAMFGQTAEFEAACTGKYALEPGYAAWCDRLQQEVLAGQEHKATTPAA